jgi:hypothetical protein
MPANGLQQQIFCWAAYRRKEISVDDDLNVGNLLETRSERAPATQSSEPMPRVPAFKYKQSFPMTALAVAAVFVGLAVVVIMGKTAKRIHIMERY